MLNSKVLIFTACLTSCTLFWIGCGSDTTDPEVENLALATETIDYEGSDYKVFRLEDDAVCESLTNIYFIEVLGGEVQTELENWTCNEISYLNVYLQVQQ